MTTTMRELRLRMTVAQLKRLHRAAMIESADTGRRVSVGEIIRRLVDALPDK